MQKIEERTLTSRKKVLIVDTHPLCRLGVDLLLTREMGWTVCGQCASADEAFKFVEKHSPDFIITDITLKESNGIDFLKSLRALEGNRDILVFSALDETLYAERALHAGARGYVMKQAAAQEFIEALKKVSAGKIHLSEAMMERMLFRKSEGISEEATVFQILSDRELEVFHLIGEGKSTSEIARCLHLSVKTIETYRANIKAKLNLGSNTQLITHAIQWLQEAQVA